MDVRGLEASLAKAMEETQRPQSTQRSAEKCKER